jgi:hypothetical protein
MVGRVRYRELPSLSESRDGKSIFSRKWRTGQRAGIPSITGGCLNLFAVVFRTERETQRHLSLLAISRQVIRTAAGQARRRSLTLREWFERFVWFTVNKRQISKFGAEDAESNLVDW